MSPQQELRPQASVSADPLLPVVHTVCEFRATPDEVMRSHTDPGLFVQWVGSGPDHARVDHWDCRTLGSYRYSLGRAGESPSLQGSFVDVTEDRLVLTRATESGPRDVCLQTITLEDLGPAQTRLSLHTLCPSFEVRDAVLAEDVVTAPVRYARLAQLLSEAAPVPDSPAGRHRRFAARFGAVVDGVGDWSVPTPVQGWTAADVVGHLVTWLPGFLGAFTSISLPEGPSFEDDPVGAWHHQADAVQLLLDDPDTAGAPCETPMFGEQSLAEVIDRIYTADVFMHTWDLAVATGQDTRLDAVFCGQLLDGMLPMDRVLRESGQYGPRVEVTETGVQAQLLGFIGRDPSWRPPPPPA